jgi:hypothetical protein
VQSVNDGTLWGREPARDQDDQRRRAVVLGGGTRCRAQNRDSVRSGRKRGFVMTTSHKRASVNGRVSGLIEMMSTQSRSPKRDTRRGTETRPEGTSISKLDPQRSVAGV